MMYLRILFKERSDNMISDKLYELAFKYKKTKLWMQLWESQIFAVKLSGGRVGYISIIGMIGQHPALNLYIGEKGLKTYKIIAQMSQFAEYTPEFQERIMQRECLQCLFTVKEELDEEERGQVKKYAREHGIKIGGKNAYPQFVIYQNNLCPWYLTTDLQQQDLCEALEAAVTLSEMLNDKTPDDLGLKRIDDNVESVVMLELKDGKHVLKKTKLPEAKIEYPAPKVINDIAIAKLKKVKRLGIWECEVIHFPQSIREEPDNLEEIPFFPTIILAVDNVTDYILPVSPVKKYEENVDQLLDLFMESFLTQAICPLKIKVKDDRTYTFLSGLCKKLNINLSKEPYLEALNYAETSLLNRFDRSEEEEIEDMLDMLEEIMELPEDELKNIPDAILKQFEILDENGLLPDDISEQFNKTFRINKEEKKEKPKRIIPEQLYIISVSLCPGCYRHIKISGNSKLLELASKIQEAFKFDNDHLHAFFMDNRYWSSYDAYFAEETEEPTRSTGRYKLREAGLYKGMKFKYIFDFGDEWGFQCKVLRVEDGEIDEPVIIRSVGEAPQQYEEDDWEDDYEDD